MGEKRKFMTCKTCGRRISVTRKQCPHCGTRYLGYEVNPPTEEQSKKDSQYCKDCIYCQKFTESIVYCNYFDAEKNPLRPCPGGEGCTVKKTRGHRKSDVLYRKNTYENNEGRRKKK